jgi:hypothetical protein
MVVQIHTRRRAKRTDGSDGGYQNGNAEKVENGCSLYSSIISRYEIQENEYKKDNNCPPYYVCGM